jgi:hypothetical protein
MSDPDDLDDEAVVEYLVDDAVVAHSHAVRTRLADNANRPWWTGPLGQQVDGSSDALLLLSRKTGQDLERSPRNLDPIDSHRKPRSAFTSSQGT